MEYMSVSQVAKILGLADRTVRNYCKLGKFAGAYIVGKTWNIPKSSVEAFTIGVKSPEGRLLQVLREQKEINLSGGIYHKTQVELTYNSNHIEGSTLTHDETRYIFETNTIGTSNGSTNVDDIVETANHFRCVDYIIDHAADVISEDMIKMLHFMLKNGTSDSRLDWFNVGEYKKLPNEVGGRETCSPEGVQSAIAQLIKQYYAKDVIGLEDIIDFHVQFETIHPFQDGNGRVGRLLMFKECLAHNIVPFIIDEAHKMFYYRGISEWNNERGYLVDTCLSCQDVYKAWLEYFKISY